MFKALQLTKGDNFAAQVTQVDEAGLPHGDVTVRVEYSTLNYKDGLAIANKSPVVRKWPMVPGIDGAGTVESSTHAGFKAGDQVVLNGWGVGEAHWGCLAGKARLKGDWLVPLPASLSTKQAMAIGTAGYTAMLCVMALQAQGVKPADGEVLVTGAAGGVGSVAIALLSGLGYRVAEAILDAADFGVPQHRRRIGGLQQALGVVAVDEGEQPAAWLLGPGQRGLDGVVTVRIRLQQGARAAGADQPRQRGMAGPQDVFGKAEAGEQSGGGDRADAGGQCEAQPGRALGAPVRASGHEEDLYGFTMSSPTVMAL